MRELQTVWDSAHFIVIGAAAITCHMGLSWRGTADLDLSVAAGLDGYVRDLERLGWRRERDAPQRWIVPNGSLVDVLPGAPALVQKGGFTWPDGGARMSLVGFRLAFEDAGSVEIAPGTTARVASLRSVVVLKMAAYFDRPRERDTDLGDIAHILSGFLPPDAEERWSDEVIGRGMDFDDVGPFVLGQQLGRLVDQPERALVVQFMDTIEDPADRATTLPRMAQRAPAGWKDPERLRQRWAAFRHGIESSSCSAT